MNIKKLCIDDISNGVGQYFVARQKNYKIYLEADLSKSVTLFSDPPPPTHLPTSLPSIFILSCVNKTIYEYTPT
jgi:hypothetical protein